MPSTPTTEPVASTAAIREAAAFADLAHWATRRGYLLEQGHADPDPGAHALACVCAAAIQADDALGLDRNCDWTDDLLDIMQLVARKGAR
jgi:hypothetical protein